MAWGLFPLFFAAAGLSVGRIGVVIAISPAVWGLGQLFTGALSDRIGRKWLIAGGQWTQAAGLIVIATGQSSWVWVAGSAIFGAGTAMAYPTLLAAIGDIAHPIWRARAVGVYRLWRDLGSAVGAVLSGVLADAVDISFAIVVVAERQMGRHRAGRCRDGPTSDGDGSAGRRRIPASATRLRGCRPGCNRRRVDVRS